MSLDQIIMVVTAVLSFAGAVIPLVFKQKNPQDISIEEIEEITKADGSKIKKHKKKYR